VGIRWRLLPRRHNAAVCTVVWTLVAFSGCATLEPDCSVVQTLPSLAHRGGLVFIADGAGDFRGTSQAVQKARAAEKLPLNLETFVWSHGYLRIFADQLDQSHARKQGQILAERVIACRQAYPDTAIYLLGHSAGCAVVLAAAEDLPPGSLERVILLAPSVPADYDIRPALKAVRESLDVFCSSQDVGYLRIGVWLSTLTNGRCHLAAGRTGFLPISKSADDARAYDKLRQHPWKPSLAWTGNLGGHYGCYQQGYLRAFVLPLLSTKRAEEQKSETR
jgi:pimeloyl-ACP methyl ester carboxylesterase